MNYSASYDRTTRIVTPLVLILGIAALLFVLLGHFEAEAFGLLRYLGAGIGFGVLGFSIALAPKSYSMEEGRILIHRMLFPSVEIPIKEIAQVERIHRKALRGSIRTFGSGGFLGYFGKFYNRKWGKMNWYATDLNKAVLIRTKTHKNYLITPDDPESFLQIRDLKKVALPL